MQFLDLVHKYEREIDRAKKALAKNPHDWPKFQPMANEAITSVFDLCEKYEKENLSNEARIYKMKRLFQKHFGEYFKIGNYTKWVVEKPLGYAGDYQIIDWIYDNKPESFGIERCSDNYFLNTGAAIATRNRKEDFKSLLKENIRQYGNSARIMDLASGPCRDIYELYLESDNKSFFVTCVDHDARAIEHSKDLISTLEQKENIEFVQKNVVKIALSKDVQAIFPHKYDIIFSTGLFDYLNHKISVRLVQNLKRLLKSGGLLLISNYRDKFSNPSRLYMEWGGDWELIYRTEEEFLQIFLDSGFSGGSLQLEFEKQRIMQYCLAKNN